MKSIHILFVSLVIWGSLCASEDTNNQSSVNNNEENSCLIEHDCNSATDTETEEAVAYDCSSVIDAETEEAVAYDCSSVIDAETEEAIEEVFRKIERKMDDDLKEGLVYFSSFLHGLMQIVEGKNQDRQLMLNGIHQSVGSLVEILMIGQKRNKLDAIANEEDLKKLIIWFARAMRQPIAKRALL